MTGRADTYGVGSPTWPGLAKLIEECGETLQVLGKLMVAPDLYHVWRQPDGTTRGSGDLTDALHEELGDLRAALDFFIDNNNQVDVVRVYRRADDKYETFAEWHAQGLLDSTPAT